MESRSRKGRKLKTLPLSEVKYRALKKWWGRDRWNLSAVQCWKEKKLFLKNNAESYHNDVQRPSRDRTYTFSVARCFCIRKYFEK